MDPTGRWHRRCRCRCRAESSPDSALLLCAAGMRLAASGRLPASSVSQPATAASFKLFVGCRPTWTAKAILRAHPHPHPPPRRRQTPPCPCTHASTSLLPILCTSSCMPTEPVATPATYRTLSIASAGPAPPRLRPGPVSQCRKKCPSFVVCDATGHQACARLSPCPCPGYYVVRRLWTWVT